MEIAFRGSAFAEVGGYYSRIEGWWGSGVGHFEGVGCAGCLRELSGERGGDCVLTLVDQSSVQGLKNVVGHTVFNLLLP